MAKLKTFPKLVLVVGVVLIVVGGLRTAAERGWIPTPGIMKALVPDKAVLPDVSDAEVTGVTPVALPTSSPVNVPATPIRMEVWEWNAQANLLFANGGATTTKGSLMEKNGVNLHIIRQDDTSQMQTDLIACAKEIHDGAQSCSSGANAVVIMGDGSAQFFAAINQPLKKLGPEYIAKVIGATGYSRGEDAFMTPPEVKSDPNAARGLLVAGVLRDGDWNIAEKWAGDNNIPSNPDEHTYDPSAINWVNAADYLKAAEAYNSSQCEDRKVVKDAHPTGEIKHVCVNAVVTWTPGDVNIARGKGGLIKVVSSKQYRSQMPAVIIGSEAFFQKNRPEIEGLLAATFEAGDQMKAFDQSLHKAADISAKVYNDQDGEYWYKYFKGVTEKDSTGLRVDLGGSAVNNLADEKILFGMQSGTNDNFRSTYSTFAKIDLQQYPKVFESTPLPPASEIEDKSFISGAESAMNSSGGDADTTNYTEQAAGSAVSSKVWEITFKSGSADLTPESEAVMRELKDSTAITGLAIQIDGYTDNSGPDSINVPLSQRRAETVRDWLHNAAPVNFPKNRFRPEGHGSQDPVASNATADGRAKNRRTVITLLGS